MCISNVNEYLQNLCTAEWVIGCIVKISIGILYSAIKRKDTLFENLTYIYATERLSYNIVEAPYNLATVYVDYKDLLMYNFLDLKQHFCCDFTSMEYNNVVVYKQ